MKTTLVRFLVVVSIFPLLPLAAADAQVSSSTLEGRALTASGTPASGARVTILELKRRTIATDDGSFRFENVPPGNYLIEAVSPRHGSAVERVAAGAGSAPVELRLDTGVHHEAVTVTGSEIHSVGEVAQPVTVLSDRELLEKKQFSLGETLAQEPGVNSTQFGAGSSRPVIRGLGGDRIRVLEAGIGTGDASTTSPDHAVSTDPLSAESIEVLRGPATLLYGSSAIGGVVNVLDGRIPDYVPDQPVTGSVELRGNTVADERSGSLVLDGGSGKLAWHLEGLKRETDDYEIPGFAAHEHEEEEHQEGEEHEEEEPIFGVLENSALESEG